MEIKILGTGCKNCKALYERALDVTNDMENVDIEYVTDIDKMMEYGVMVTPALVVDGKIESVGLIKKEKILKIIS